MAFVVATALTFTLTSPAAAHPGHAAAELGPAHRHPFGVDLDLVLAAAVFAVVALALGWLASRLASRPAEDVRRDLVEARQVVYVRREERHPHDWGA